MVPSVPRARIDAHRPRVPRGVFPARGGAATFTRFARFARARFRRARGHVSRRGPRRPPPLRSSTQGRPRTSYRPRRRRRRRVCSSLTSRARRAAAIVAPFVSSRSPPARRLRAASSSLEREVLVADAEPTVGEGTRAYALVSRVCDDRPCGTLALLFTRDCSLQSTPFRVTEIREGRRGLDAWLAEGKAPCPAGPTEAGRALAVRSVRHAVSRSTLTIVYLAARCPKTSVVPVLVLVASHATHALRGSRASARTVRSRSARSRATTRRDTVHFRSKSPVKSWG